MDLDIAFFSVTIAVSHVHNKVLNKNTHVTANQQAASALH